MSYARDIRTDANTLAKSATETVMNTAADAAEMASEKLDQAKSVATEIAGDALSKGREAGKQIDAVASNLKGALEKSINDQPMATLAVAALAGFVIGAIWKS